MAGGEGFEPSTPNLGGWCSIRTELLAQTAFKRVLDLPLLATSVLLVVDKKLYHLISFVD